MNTKIEKIKWTWTNRETGKQVKHEFYRKALNTIPVEYVYSYDKKNWYDIWHFDRVVT